MRDKIKQLESTSRLLDPDQKQRALWDQQVLDYTNAFLANLEVNKTFNSNLEQGRAISEFNITEQPTDLANLLEGTTKNIDDVGINPGSGGHMGYIPGGGLYPSALGDYIAAISNRYAGIFYAAPGAVRLENMLIRWMCDLMEYPATSLGNLTSGGSIANLVAIVTARDAINLKSRDFERAVIYLSEQAHHSVQKALRIAGMSEAQLRYIPMDDGLRLSVSALENAIREDKANGLLPFFINSSFGTTNTGAIDPLDSIADLAEQHKIWFHVDASYGGFFKLVEEIEPKFKGIARADSITLDPHKTLFLPFGSGAILIKDGSLLFKTHHYLAEYMQDTVDANEEVSPADISPELTKHFRGMRLWLPLKLFGLAPFRSALKEKLLLAQYFHRRIQTMKGFEVGPDPELSVAMFRYLPKLEDANSFNKALIKAIQDDGRIFLSSTTIDGIFWIRVAVVVFRTHLEHVDLLLEIIGQKVKELRQS